MSEMVLEVEPREDLGKNANRRLRAVGEVPAVVYGGGLEPKPIRVGKRRVEEILRSRGGENSVFLLKMKGTDKSRHAMIRELQTDAITGAMVHIDFHRIAMDQTVRVEVPVELKGEAVGVKTEGGLVDFVTRVVEVECLPDRIPASFELDISALHIGQHVEAGELEMPEGVELHDDPERVIVSIAHRQKAEEAVEEEEEEMLLEAEEEEPEVIQKGKTEEEG